MGKRLDPARLRGVTKGVRQSIKRLAHSRTAPAWTVERAHVVHAALEGKQVEEIAVHLGLTRATVYLWLHSFEAKGLAGLEEAPRWGRPPTYTREQVGTIVATALTDPHTLGLPFKSRALDRLATYLSVSKASP